ncbi:hypothetical protein [Dactylosporangium sp. CA-092794]|uniref:hypothetical protein n=1 Tax=Dactylosporangium sp. CA-092794 TaxID=3239929 RepID=UPI003D8EBBD6
MVFPSGSFAVPHAAEQSARSWAWGFAAVLIGAAAAGLVLVLALLGYDMTHWNEIYDAMRDPDDMSMSGPVADGINQIFTGAELVAATVVAVALVVLAVLVATHNRPAGITAMIVLPVLLLCCGGQCAAISAGSNGLLMDHAKTQAWWVEPASVAGPVIVAVASLASVVVLPLALARSRWRTA